jgi:hypothetical protein
MRAKDAIRLAWLSVLGLHIPGFAESLSADRYANADDRWCCTYLSSPSYLAAIFPSEATQKRITADSYAGIIVGREREYANGFGPVKNWGHGVIGTLESIDGKSGLWTREDVQGVDGPLVRRVFAQLRPEVEDVEWDMLSLAFDSATNIKRCAEMDHLGEYTR